MIEASKLKAGMTFETADGKLIRVLEASHHKPGKGLSLIHIWQFLGNMEKPDVDSIDGLSPAISIDQKTTSKNPRSTVGTVTEINDYLRLLYARVGTPYCVNGLSLIHI